MVFYGIFRFQEGGDCYTEKNAQTTLVNFHIIQNQSVWGMFRDCLVDNFRGLLYVCLMKVF